MTVEIEFRDILGAEDLVIFGLANSGTAVQWRCSPDEQATIDALDQLPFGRQPPASKDTVRRVGSLLRQKLDVLDPVRHALTETFAHATLIQTPRPLYFRIGSPNIEAVPFETIWDNQLSLFAALDPRWSIARIPADTAEPSGPYTMPRPLRLVAILAAEGEDGGAQLTALRAAAQARPQLPVEATILTSNPAMKAAIDDEAAPGWSAELVPPTTDQLIIRLRELRPQLLHIFCHGTAAEPRLLISQLEDLATLEITAGHLADLAKPAPLAPWLVTLNCCEGAAPGEQVGSLAAAIVRAGLPAALGMRKPVSKALADDFCTDLYQAVFHRLAEIAPTGRAVSDLDWAAVISEPRRRLCARLGACGDIAVRQREWTLPILYLATPRLKVRGQPTAVLHPDIVEEQIMALSVPDELEKKGNLRPEMADQLRRPSLDRLYPGP